MGKAQDRSAALTALETARRTAKPVAAAATASFTAVMAGVGVNSITAQNITDLNAAQTSWNVATAGYEAACVAVLVACRALEDA